MTTRSTAKPANPFKPGKRLTRPDLFAGRTPQLEDGASLLKQAAAGNARHGLITGDRGIGKSSLSSQIQGIARGDAAYLALLDETDRIKFNFLTAEIVAERGEGPADIATGLLQELDRSRGKNLGGIRFDWELDLKIIKGKFREATAPRDVTLGFVDAIEAVAKSLDKRASGIVLVIDEIDRVATQQGVSTFLKVATETMSARGLENVMFLAVGMVGVRELLADEHASTPRIFETIHVPTLSDVESMDIVAKALEPTAVTINGATNRLIAELSGGFPQPVHLIGSEAYEADTDWVIDNADLNKGIQSVVGVKAREEFDAQLLIAGSGRNRQIVKSMANYSGSNVPIAHVCEELDVIQPEISANIGLLMKREVIVRVDRGVYRIKDPLFSIYVATLGLIGDEPIERRPRRRKPKTTKS